MKYLFFLFIVFLSSKSNAQTKIYTSDITHFWQAYDQIRKIDDTTKQLQLIKTIYFDQASKGCQDFIKASEINPKSTLKTIKKLPKFWASIRPKTLDIQKQTKQLETIIARYKKLYPAYKQPIISFSIGCLSMGGTTYKDEILIGAEIASADSSVDASEVGNWLKNVFQKSKGIQYLVAHEMTHTQQPDGDSENDGKSNLLGYCIIEGAADFIAELLLEKPLNSPYIAYGKYHEKELWKKFQKEMNGQNIDNWLYNGGKDSIICPDLGYFEGYAICKSYYTQAQNKAKAIADIIELDRKNMKTLNSFLFESKYAAKWN